MGSRARRLNGPKFGVFAVCGIIALYLLLLLSNSAAAAPGDCLGSPIRDITFTSDSVIHLKGCNETFTLSEVAAAPAVGPSRLELVDAVNKVWFLKVNLKVEEGATLNVVGGAI